MDASVASRCLSQAVECILAGQVRLLCGRPSLPTVRPERTSRDGGSEAMAAGVTRLRAAAAGGKGRFLLATFQVGMHILLLRAVCWAAV